MKVDAYSSNLAVFAYYGGLQSQQSSSCSSCTEQEDDSAAKLDRDSESSSLKAVEASGAAREDHAIRHQAEFSEEEKQVIDQLKARDREVRAHEAAHKGAAGSLAHGAATFSYEAGPDGKRYAVGGEVSIDTSAVPGNPQATIVKAQIIYRAATAPAQPSSQDRSVAAMASQMEAQARQELSQEKLDEQKPVNGEPNVSSAEQREAQSQAIDTAITPTTVGELIDASV